jgi:predicted metal-dependent hydrolase
MARDMHDFVKGSVVISGIPDWWDVAESVLTLAGFSAVSHEVPGTLAVRLADDHAAMLLVDGMIPDWQQWVGNAKANAATRRIPVVVVAAESGLLATAAGSGADAVLMIVEMEEMLPRLLAAHGRVIDPAYMEALARQCAQPLPPLGKEGIRQFNQGEYYRQHDLFEELWKAEQGPVRDLYRAILQVGVAYYQLQRGNYRGALKMLLRSIQWLTPLPDVCQGVDVARLKADSAAVRLALESTRPDQFGAFDMSLLKPVRLTGEGDDSGFG